MLTLTNLSYIHPNGDVLFDGLHLTINQHEKIALIGNNGVGKSTLLKMMAGRLTPTAGTAIVNSKLYYVAQHIDQLDHKTVAQALHVDTKLKALEDIIAGNATDANLTILDDDWLLEERCYDALAKWALSYVNLNTRLENLSGGQKTKVLLAGITVHQPEIVLLDEPSNHLDSAGRDILYDYIRSTSHTLVVVSHDRTLLNLLSSVYELNKIGLSLYGGNYDFYKAQKEAEQLSLYQDIASKEKAIRKAKEVQRESLERKQKLDARGKKKQEKAGLPTISMNTFRNNAEKSTARLKDTHTEKIDVLSQSLRDVRKELPAIEKIKIDLGDSGLYKGKKLLSATAIQAGYQDKLLWKQPLTFSITNGERIAIQGTNGSGKTTLLKIILGEIEPKSGKIERSASSSIYFDQHYSLINNTLTVYEQAQQFNYEKLQEHEVKIRLNRFLFSREYWDNPCSTLSGGEKMRLMLCCLMIGNRAPDIIALDEPTNNLDIQNIEMLTTAIAEYKGTLMVISHDRHFLQHVQVTREIVLE